MRRQNGLSFTSKKTGAEWKCRLRAANLVPNDGGDSRLPAPIGDIRFHTIANPAQYGIPAQHPLQKRFPNLEVQNLFMVIENRFLVERERIQGVALYADYNQSEGLSASITSENGRNPLAPWDWEGKPGSPTDPAAQPYLEWRRVEDHVWQSHMIHGWKGWNEEEERLDWRDGIPESLMTMYDRKKGRVGQSIMVPHEIVGISAAEQTLQQPDVKKSYNILLFFPNPESARGIQTISYGYGGGYRGMGAMKGLGATRGSDSFRGVFEEPEVDYKMAVGGWINQHVIKDPFGPHFWNPNPEALIVCWPIKEERARQILGSNLQGQRKTF